MVEVRIRIEKAGNEAIRLAEVPFDQLGTVIPSLQEWGVVDAFDDMENAYGQFAVLEDGAYFEVVVPINP